MGLNGEVNLEEQEVWVEWCIRRPTSHSEVEEEKLKYRAPAPIDKGRSRSFKGSENIQGEKLIPSNSVRYFAIVIFTYIPVVWS